MVGVIAAFASFLPNTFANQAEKINQVLTNVSERMVSQPVFRGDFWQSKQINGMRKPLESRGTFTLVSAPLPEGILWQITQPIELRYWLHPKGMIEFSPAGQRVARSISDVPALGQVSQLFTSLLRLNPQDLTKKFQVTWRQPLAPETWRLLLTPQPELARYIRSVLIAGDQYIQTIQVDEVNQDKLTLRFINVETSMALSNEESKWLLSGAK
ncbi:outer membrane lipoprotein carrier protein LolA [Parvibium lacunae]|uniref:Outer membrane lipoprotein carrier protein LolA n=2 Tax=Parvibium lacunae TaxID=1888893 RepID=A0A368L1S2_9BURK|nr:outer membrane lipoprotein carrier protein LolA [Parvibium lacunae]